MEKLRERGSRAHGGGGGWGGPAVVIKPRAPRRVSPAQSTSQWINCPSVCIFGALPTSIEADRARVAPAGRSHAKMISFRSS